MPGRVKAGFKAGIKMVWILCIPIVTLYLFAAKLLITFFISSPSQLALTSGVQFLYIAAPFYFIISIKLIADGILRGAGMMRDFMISTFTDLILRVGLAYFFADFMGVTGVWWSWPLGWGIAMVVSQIFYHMGLWKRKHNI